MLPDFSLLLKAKKELADLTLTQETFSKYLEGVKTIDSFQDSDYGVMAGLTACNSLQLLYSIYPLCVRQYYCKCKFLAFIARKLAAEIFFDFELNSMVGSVVLYNFFLS